MLSSRKKITFIIPYFGKNFPKYFPLFLNSVKYNPDYDFLCFTNIIYNEIVPSNFKIIPFSLSNVSTLIKEKIDINTQFDNAYKLCDLKPCYGFIFQNYIKDADFWGHIDIDLVLGNLNQFLYDDQKLKNYDILSFRQEWLSGSFALYKNVDVVNSLFKKSKDWERVFETPTYLGFDECSRANKKGFSIFGALMKGKDLLSIPTEIESFTKVLFKSNLRIHFKTLIKESIAYGMLIKYEKGTIEIFKSGKSNLINKERFLHYHYISEKRSKYFKYPNWDISSDKFYISKYGFHKNMIHYYLRVFSVKLDLILKKLFK